MAKVTLTTAKVTATDAKQATELVAKYRDGGNGSNRTDWSRVTAVLTAVLAVVKSGKSVEVTGLFADMTDAKAPAYNIAHRTLSQGAIRPEWHKVRIVALFDTTDTKGMVTGESSTTAKVGRVRLFIAPAE